MGCSRLTSMRVVALRREDKQVDDIDDPDPEVSAEVLAEERGGVDDLLGQLVADTDEDNVWVDTLVDRVVCVREARGMDKAVNLPHPVTSCRKPMLGEGAGGRKKTHSPKPTRRQCSDAQPPQR